MHQRTVRLVGSRFGVRRGKLLRQQLALPVRRRQLLAVGGSPRDRTAKAADQE
jgi:hypothetical protein